MFTDKTNKPSGGVIKTFLRLKDKKSYPLMLKLPIISSQLKEMVIKKTKIPEDDLILMYQGKQINLKNNSQPISISDKSILHVINKKNIRNDILEVLIRFVFRNQERSCLGQTKLLAKHNQSIHQFIERQVLPVIQQITGRKLCVDDVGLVFNGDGMRKDMHFHDYLVENGAEIICMIKYMEQLQKSVNNISTHKLIAHRRQMQLQHQAMEHKQEKQQSLQREQYEQQEQKKQQEKQSSSKIGHKQSGFIKMQELQNNKQLDKTQQRILQKEKDDHNYDEDHEQFKLKKKDKITSGEVEKFQNEHPIQQYKSQNKKEIKDNNNQPKQALNPYEQNLHTENTPNDQPQTINNQPKENQTINVYEDDRQHNLQPEPIIQPKKLKTIQNKQKNQPPSNQLSLYLSNLLGKNVANGYYENEPDSPVEIDYPKIQKKSASNVQWDDGSTLQAQKQPEIPKVSDNDVKQLNSVQQSTKPKEVEQTNNVKENQQKLKSYQISGIKLGDFIMIGGLSDKRHSKQDYINVFTNGFNSLLNLNQKCQKSQIQTVHIKQPKLNKCEVKSGDFIICGDILSNSSQMVNETLVNRFNDLLKQKNQNKRESHCPDQQSKMTIV